MNAMQAYINDALQELHKVRWPTRQQAIRFSIIVIGFTAAASVSLGFVDFVLSKVVTFLLTINTL